jgi:uncharacterized damage-inducible protein DinB
MIDHPTEGAFMFRRIDDFAAAFTQERENTLRLFGNLTDETLGQAIVPGSRTLGFLAWHLVCTFPEMMGHAGLEPEGPALGEPVPASAADIVAGYDRASASTLEQVKARWQDDMLDDMLPMYGETWPRGVVLEALIRHEAHHRGQMTVLMRQAGLPVAGMYGPSREEWAAYGMEPHP